MARFLIIIPLIVVVVDIFAIVDVVLIEQRRVRAIPKAAWIILILLLPILGAVLWYTLGKQRKEPGRTGRQVAPDDDPAFLKRLGQEDDVDARIRKLEQELAELDDDQPTKD